MGKWKYVNWLITLIVLVHMYRYFFVRYQASASLYLLSTIGWILVGAAGYYIFVVRMRRPDKIKARPIVQPPGETTPVRKRPKVVFKRKDADSK